MKEERRQYTAEFKAEALRLWEAGGTGATDLARDLGIHPTLLWKWRRKARQRAGGLVAGGEPGLGKGAATEAEVQRLKRELEQVKLERDFLKKAAAFFARESR